MPLQAFIYKASKASKKVEGGKEIFKRKNKSKFKCDFEFKFPCYRA